MALSSSEGSQGEREFDELLHQANTGAADMMKSPVQFIGGSDITAYLVMRANRLLQLQCVLKANRFTLSTL